MQPLRGIVLTAVYVSILGLVAYAVRRDGKGRIMSLAYGALWPWVLMRSWLFTSKEYRRTLPPDHPRHLPR